MRRHREAKMDRPKSGMRSSRRDWRQRGRRGRRYVLTTLLLTVGLLLPLLAQSVGTSTAAGNGGTLTIVAVGSNTIGLDPAGPSDGQVSSLNYQYDPVFEPLFIAENNGSLGPWLATGYETSNGGKTITLDIRHGINFQDGTPFNAAAVVFNLERYASVTQNSECVTYDKQFLNAKAVGPYTVVVNFSAPDPAWLSSISGLECGLMASPTAVKKEGSKFGLEPVGTGPFKLTQFGLTGSTWTASKNYWRKGYPLLSGLKFILVGSNTAAMAALQSGEAQLYFTAVPEDVVNGRKISSLVTTEIPGTGTITNVGYQLRTAPFNNPVARKAVTEAINPAPLLKVAGDGLYTPGEGFIGPGSWAFNGTKVKGYPEYNPAAAKKLVKSIPGGIKFTMQLQNSPAYEQMAALLQAQWAAVGINATLEPLQESVFITNLHHQNFQAWLSQIGGGPVPPNDPDLIAHRWLYSTSPLNQDGIKDPEMDKLLNESVATFNHAKRKKIYGQIEQLAAKDLPWADLFFATSWDIETKSLQNFKADLDYANFWNMSVK